jgi:hypothetical protein
MFYDGHIEPFLVAEVIIDSGQIDAGASADFADSGFPEPTVREYFTCRFKDSVFDFQSGFHKYQTLVSNARILFRAFVSRSFFQNVRFAAIPC